MESMSNPIPSISMLLVEDEELTLYLLSDILTKKYPEIPLYTAINGRRGLELFKSHTPNIVMTDINMPEMGGVQMAGKIRTVNPYTKFIILTGTCEKIDLQDSVEKGFEFDHFIVKPVIFQELFAAIEQCICGIVQH